MSFLFTLFLSSVHAETLDFVRRIWQTARKRGQFDETMTKIDETDRALVALLSADARMPVSDLARRLGLARTTVQARIENLFDEEVATGLSSSGLRSIGQPRSAWINVNYRF